MTAVESKRIAEAIRRLLADRGPTKSICPSEVARRVDPAAWRERMRDVRKVAFALADGGEIEITQGDRRISSADHVRGHIRLRLPLK